MSNLTEMVVVLCITRGQEWNRALQKEADVKNVIPMSAVKTILSLFVMVAPILYAHCLKIEYRNSEHVMIMILNYISHRNK